MLGPPPLHNLLNYIHIDSNFAFFCLPVSDSILGILLFPQKLARRKNIKFAIGDVPFSFFSFLSFGQMPAFFFCPGQRGVVCGKKCIARPSLFPIGSGGQQKLIFFATGLSVWSMADDGGWGEALSFPALEKKSGAEKNKYYPRIREKLRSPSSGQKKMCGDVVIKCLQKSIILIKASIVICGFQTRIAFSLFAKKHVSFGIWSTNTVFF